jgi:membrane fusion protein, heavy metal efflux system
MKKHLLFSTFGFLCLGFIAQSCHKANAANGQTEVGKKEKFCISDTLSKMITIENVVTEPILDELQLSGEVTYNEDNVVRVMPLTSGQIIDTKVQIGDYVKRGQTLAVMKTTEGVSNYNELRSAERDIAIAKKNMDATESLSKSGMGTDRDFQLAKEEYEKSQVAVERIKGMQSIYGTGSANGVVTITAPHEGYIIEKKINTGSVVRPDNADNLFTIGDIADVFVTANVFETDISRVRTGLPVEIKTLAYPDKIFKGKVDKISNMLDPQNKALKVRIGLENPDKKLKPEMFTSVLVHNTEGVKAIAIPTSALLFDFGKQYVVVYKDKCDVEAREVTVLKTVGDRTYIASGIKEGERLITHNQILVYQSFKE